MNFKNRRIITAGVDLKVHPILQVFMWHLIDALPEPKDYCRCSPVQRKKESKK